jgi:hypothetical protein
VVEPEPLGRDGEKHPQVAMFAPVLSLSSLTAAISCNRIAFAAAYFSSDGGYHFIQAYIYRNITGFIVIDDWFLAMVVAVQVAVSLIIGLLILRSRTGNRKPDERRT